MQILLDVSGQLRYSATAVYRFTPSEQNDADQLVWLTICARANIVLQPKSCASTLFSSLFWRWKPVYILFRYWVSANTFVTNTLILSHEVVLLDQRSAGSSFGTPNQPHQSASK